MKTLFHNIGRNIVDIFRGKNLLWHLLAIVSTYLIVISGFDWRYFQYFNGTEISRILFSAAIVGGLVPILAPTALFIIGKIRKNGKLLDTGFALLQSVILGWSISSLYKTFTGRAHPEIVGTITDITHTFNFGIFRGVFWGWPSSHTTIAFAMAFTLWNLYPKNKTVRILSLIYALYIGIGVSMTIHWFSDFTAGVIIGTVIGTVVGKAFKAREDRLSQSISHT